MLLFISNKSYKIEGHANDAQLKKQQMRAFVNKLQHDDEWLLLLVLLLLLAVAVLRFKIELVAINHQSIFKQFFPSADAASDTYVTVLCEVCT